MSIAIKIENLSKQYRLGLVSTRTLSHDLNRWWQTSILGREDPYLKIGEENKLTTRRTPEAGRRMPDDYVWALKDINLEVEEGEVLGIIGKNGAGKSTLLKILSKVTSPTTGSIKARGRIASLLEVGTGFHYEMTGRENIYLNGAILGMTKAEINRKLDEIIDFAGVERYIDTPVKRYSSGMMVRLGFAVAAHLDPEILVVDEVLAVGDAEFQKKAVGKMQNISNKQGRTILFVSHQLGSVQQLCNDAICMENGIIKKRGTTDLIIQDYVKSSFKNFGAIFEANDEDLKKEYYIKKFWLNDQNFNKKNSFGIQESIRIIVEFGFSTVRDNVEIGIALFDSRDIRVWTIHEPLFENLSYSESGKGTIIIEIPPGYLTPGSYYFIATIHIPHIESFHLIEGVSKFNVVETGSRFSNYDGINIGLVFPKYTLQRNYDK